MTNEIKKYTYRIEWSEEDHCHIARCLEFPSLAAHGDTNEGALREIEYVVAESVKWMKKDGETVPEPFGLKKFKGHLTLRIPPEKHRELSIRCAEEGVSLNRFILSRLSA
jgi:predicted HicB family RNase H-like nuclease